MFIGIELRAGKEGRKRVAKSDIQKNIDAQRRAIDGKSLAGDHVLLNDTLSILTGIREKLPDV